MNKKKAIAIISKSASITLYQNIDGSSWLSNGYALYNMGIFPYCENEDEVASVLGLTEKQVKETKITISDHFPFALGTMKRIPGLYPASFTLKTAGRTLYILSSNEQVSVAVDETYLKPFNSSDETSYNAYAYGDHIALVEVCYGIIEVGYICPQCLDSVQIEKILKTIKALPTEVSDNVQL
ncbi:MAG: hypothetical protein J5956_02640 [Ruminococcus sp.]|nr:hypothetical protein [Ruminococcus sp.]